MKLLAYLTRTLLAFATLAALLLLGVAFLFNDTNLPTARLLALWGGYPLIGLILIVVNEVLLRKLIASRSFWRNYVVFWACVVVTAGITWSILVNQ